MKFFAAQTSTKVAELIDTYFVWFYESGEAGWPLNFN